MLHFIYCLILTLHVRKEEEEERRESEGSGRHRRGGAKLALLPPIFELKIILEEP